MVWSSVAPKWPITVPFCRIDHQNSNFHWYLIVFLSEAVEARRCHFFWKLVGKTQIPKPSEATRNHNSIKLLIFLPFKIWFTFDSSLWYTLYIFYCQRFLYQRSSYGGTVIRIVKNCPKNQTFFENKSWASIYPSQVIEVHFYVIFFFFI